jgi:FkbM family methyltransferase
METLSFLKRFTYRPELIWLARACGLRGFLRKCYFWWARPPDGILRIEVSGTNAQFYVRTPEELRMLGKAQSGHWEGEILQFLISQLRAGDVVYDIGASVGLYTALLGQALRDRGQVIAFEPERQSQDRLRENLRLNGLTNVRAFRVALGDYSGEGKLYFSGDDLLFSNLVRPRTTSLTHQENHQVVQVVRGDEFREIENLPFPRIVKIDVEGYEYAVIRGLTRTLSDSGCELVSCEVHPTLLPLEVKPEQVVDLLRSLGFGRIDLHRWRGIPECHVLASKAGK